MGTPLSDDLARFSKMAFVRASDCSGVIRRFHGLENSPKSKVQGPKSVEDRALLEKVYEWVFVPRTIWPVDVKGFCEHLLECVEAGKGLDEETRVLCSLLPEAPTVEVCDAISRHEHSVKAGSYESLINAQFKFDSMELELEQNEELKADWESLKARFPVERYRNARGVIRRRMVQERSLRPKDWTFSWGTEEERFRNLFDVFCNKWNLYGMENDRPLLLKLSVNLTPFSTMIEVPRYWSFDPKRDLKWGVITELHRMREVPRQGPKLDPSRAARRDEAARAKELWRQATRAGLKGDRRTQWVMGRLGWDERTDESKLRRMLKSSKLQKSGK